MSTTKNVKSPLQTWPDGAKPSEIDYNKMFESHLGKEMATVSDGEEPPSFEELTISFHKAVEESVQETIRSWSRDKTDEELEIVFDQPAADTRKELGLDEKPVKKAF